MRRVGTGSRSVSAVGSLVGLVVLVLVAAGCSVTRGGQASPLPSAQRSGGAGSSAPYPPPPKTLVTGPVNPCKLMTSQQLERLGWRQYTDAPRPFEIENLYTTTKCSFVQRNEIQEGVALQVAPVPMTVFLDSSLRQPGKLTDPVQGYPVSVQSGDVGGLQCLVNVAVAPEQTLVAQGGHTGKGEGQMDTLCAHARTFASAAITTLENR